MADTLLTHDMLAQRALFDLQNELTFSAHVYKGYNSEFGSVGRFKKGNSVRIQLPNKFRANSGIDATSNIVDHYERNTTVTVDEQYHVAWDFTETELTLDVEEFSRKYIRPACITLANKVDSLGCSEYVNVYNLVGTPGTTPSTFSVLADAAARLDNESVPREGRVCVFSPMAHWAMADGELKGIFQQNVVDRLLRKGFIGNFALMDFFMDQNIATHTTGAFESDILINDTMSEGDTNLITDGWGGSSDVHQGDVLTCAATYGVNPVSGQTWEGSQLRQFVVTAQTDDVSADMTIPVSPTLYSSSATSTYLPYQTVDTLPANNAAVTFVGTASTGYAQNLAFHPNAFALTVVPYSKPMSAGKSVMWGSANDPQMGLSIVVSTGFDILLYKEITRLDILFGWDTPEPNYAVRITG